MARRGSIANGVGVGIAFGIAIDADFDTDTDGDTDTEAIEPRNDSVLLLDQKLTLSTVWLKVSAM